MKRLVTSPLRLDGSRWQLGALAGLAGGAAEIAWVWLYSGLGGADGIAVARGVAAAFFSAVAATSMSAALGITIHMVLAILLGIAVALATRAFLPHSRSALLEPCLVVAALAGVWAFNFYVLLPLIHPEFVLLLPLSVSFASKLSFGVAAAFVLSVASGRCDARQVSV